MKYIIVVLSLTLNALRVTGQHQERPHIQTDRNLYVAGEKIRFAAELSSTEPDNASGILYVELITGEGKQITGKKYALADGRCSGELELSTSLVTGNYFLRSYTKYLRSSGPAYFDHLKVIIVNPSSAAVLKAKTKDAKEDTIAYERHSDPSIEIALSDSAFDSREKVGVELTLKGPLKALTHVTVSVIPAESHDPIGVQLNAPSSKFQPGVVERNGTLLQGRLMGLEDAAEEMPMVNMTVMEKWRNTFYPISVDKQGYFTHQFNTITGSKDLFLSVDADPEGVEIAIQNDYYSGDPAIDAEGFDPTDEQLEAALSMARNMQVVDYFKDSPEDQGSTISQHDSLLLPFYGAPDKMIMIDDYVDLPFISDYLKEIILPVRVSRLQGRRTIEMTGDAAELKLFPPLIMVDFAPIYNVEALLKIPYKKAKRIDIIAEPYVRGSATYGGLLNVITRNNDFAGIRLPSTGLFLEYTFLEEQQGAPATELSIHEGPQIGSNTLFWRPFLKVEQGSASFSFNTGDYSGEYRVVVQGLLQDRALGSASGDVLETGEQEVIAVKEFVIR